MVLLMAFSQRYSFGRKIVRHSSSVSHCCDRMFAILLKLRDFLVRKCFGRFNWNTFGTESPEHRKNFVPTNNALLSQRREEKKKRCRCRDLPQTHQFRVHECTRQRWIRNQSSALGLGLQLNHPGCAATENRIQFPLRRRKFNRYVNEMTKTCGDKNNKITEAAKSFRSLINACSRLSFCSTLHTKRQVWFYCAENCTRWRKLGVDVRSHGPTSHKWWTSQRARAHSKVIVWYSIALARRHDAFNLLFIFWATTMCAEGDKRKCPTAKQHHACTLWTTASRECNSVIPRDTIHPSMLVYSYFAKSIFAFDSLLCMFLCRCATMLLCIRFRIVVQAPSGAAH